MESAAIGAKPPQITPTAYKILNMQENKKKHKTYLEIDSNSRTGGISCVRFTEKLKGAEKVAMQVLHVVMTYDYIRKIHVMRKK